MTTEISELMQGLKVRPVGKFVFEPSGQRYHHVKYGEYKYTEPKLERVNLYPPEMVDSLCNILSLMEARDARSHQRRCELVADLADRNAVILEQSKQIAELQARIDELNSELTADDETCFDEALDCRIRRKPRNIG